jgi:hypothetical protein
MVAIMEERTAPASNDLTFVFLVKYAPGIRPGSVQEGMAGGGAAMVVVVSRCALDA